MTLNVTSKFRSEKTIQIFHNSSGTQYSQKQICTVDPHIDTLYQRIDPNPRDISIKFHPHSSKSSWLFFHVLLHIYPLKTFIMYLFTFYKCANFEINSVDKSILKIEKL